MKLSSAIGLAMCGALAVASIGTAEQRTSARQEKTVGVDIALQAGGDTYQFTGQANCWHSPNGFIFGTPAKQWAVSHRDNARSLSLTFWKPTRKLGVMFSFQVQGGGKTYEATTVKTDQDGSTKGSGEVTFTPASAGGTFTVNATAANGAKISGTIKCSGFAPVHAEAGN
jgi:hypothetical protein